MAGLLSFLTVADVSATWTAEQLLFLQQNYQTATPDELVVGCGHPWSAVKNRAQRLELNRQSKPCDVPVLVTDYQAGLSMQELRIKHGLSAPTIYQLLDTAGVSRRNRSLVGVDASAFAEDWTGLPMKDLRLKYGTSIPTLRKKVQELGLGGRKLGQPLRLNQAQQNDVVAGLAAGKTMEVLAEQHDVSPGAVGLLARRRGCLPSREDVVRKARQTNLLRYDAVNPFGSAVIQKKIRARNLVKYGVEHPLQNPEVLARVAATNLTRYGSASPLGSPAVKARIIATNLARYGVKSPMQSPEVQARAVATNLVRYGSSNPFGSSTVRAKIIATNLARYGTPGPPNSCYGKTQAEIQEWLASLGFAFNPDRTILQGREIDLFSLDLRLGIEYCGLFWHNEESPQPRGPSYHFDKYRRCLEQGVRLITVFEDEWLHREAQVKNFLRSVLGRNEVRLHARKCRVVDLEKPEAAQFCERHHIQGAAHLGLHFAGLQDPAGRLVGVMSLGRHHRGGRDLVLDRLCFAGNVSVVGGASRLLRHLVKVSAAGSLVSWSDNRWSAGSVYRQMGFTLGADLPPDYSYVDDNQPGVRLSKQSQKKAASGCPAGLTEKEWSRQRGLFRIWDCGKQRWHWTSRAAADGAGDSLPSVSGNLNPIPA